MDFIRIVTAVVVAIAKPFGLNTSRCRVPATTADAVAHRLRAVGFVFSVIAVLVTVAHLIQKQSGILELLFIGGGNTTDV